MFQYITALCGEADAFFWGYIAFSLIIVLGSYLTWSTRFFQIRALPCIISTFIRSIVDRSQNGRGVQSIKTFFASVGGMLGVGNIVGIVTAVQLGGPGALLWVWIAAFFGAIIKYSEVYLGLKYRVANSHNSYDGGPMFFIRRAFNKPWISIVICLLLCVYGAEIYQFNVLVDVMSYSLDVPRISVTLALLFFVVYAALGGVQRVGKICGAIMPFFIVIYLAMALFVVVSHYKDLGDIFLMVVRSAFTGHAAVGGFLGSSMMLAIQNGMAGACYSADIGIGFDATIQSESAVVHPEEQARMAFFGVVLDNFICTLSILVVLVTGVWQLAQGDARPLVQIALDPYFPYMEIIMPSFIFILGYTTLIAYLVVGMKCARYIHPTYGTRVYLLYSIVVFLFFSFFDQTQALFMMRIAGALLLIINLLGVFLLRRDICFSHREQVSIEEA